MSLDRVHPLPGRTAGVLSRRVGDEYVVIHPTTKTAHALSGTPAAVWGAIEDGETPALEAAEVDSALDQLIQLGLVQIPGVDRRTMLRRGGVVVGVAAISSLALPEALAAASTLMPKTLTGSGSFSIPQNARDVKISVTGGSGGLASTFSGTAGAAGSVVWNLGAGYHLASALLITYNIGTMGATGTTLGGGTGGNGGTGAFAGGKGGDGTNSGGGGGGGASRLIFSGAATGFVIAGGGGGAGEGPRAANPGGVGGSVDSNGFGGVGGSGTNPTSVGGTAGGAVGGTGAPGASASNTFDDAGGGGGGGGKNGGAGTGAANPAGSRPAEVAGGGGAGSDSINDGTPLSLNSVSPSTGASATGNGSLIISYVI